MEKQGLYIVGIGEVLWDILLASKTRKLGGAPANFAYHTAQFNMKSLLISAVGKDDLGEKLLEDLKEAPMTLSVEKVDYPTGTVEVDETSEGPLYKFTEQVAWDYLPFTEKLKCYAAQTCVVCFGSLAQRNPASRGTINAFIDAIPKDGTRWIIYDINMRSDSWEVDGRIVKKNFYDEEVVRESLRRCNTLKLNEKELKEVCNMFGYTDAGEEAHCRRLMAEYGLKIVILTLGGEGSYVFTEDDSSFYRSEKVDSNNSIGAGDSFTATFITAILKGKSVREAHMQASDVAAFVCTQPGATPQLPRELIDRMN